MLPTIFAIRNRIRTAPLRVATPSPMLKLSSFAQFFTLVILFTVFIYIFPKRHFAHSLLTSIFCLPFSSEIFSRISATPETAFSIAFPRVFSKPSLFFFSELVIDVCSDQKRLKVVALKPTYEVKLSRSFILCFSVRVKMTASIPKCITQSHLLRLIAIGETASTLSLLHDNLLV